MNTGLLNRLIYWMKNTDSSNIEYVCVQGLGIIAQGNSEFRDIIVSQNFVRWTIQRSQYFKHPEWDSVALLSKLTHLSILL